MPKTHTRLLYSQKASVAPGRLVACVRLAYRGLEGADVGHHSVPVDHHPGDSPAGGSVVGGLLCVVTDDREVAQLSVVDARLHLSPVHARGLTTDRGVLDAARAVVSDVLRHAGQPRHKLLRGGQVRCAAVDDVPRALSLAVLADDLSVEAALRAGVPTPPALLDPALDPRPRVLVVLATRLRREEGVSEWNDLEVDDVRQPLCAVGLVQRPDLEVLAVGAPGLDERLHLHLSGAPPASNGLRARVCVAHDGGQVLHRLTHGLPVHHRVRRSRPRQSVVGGGLCSLRKDRLALDWVLVAPADRCPVHADLLRTGGRIRNTVGAVVTDVPRHAGEELHEGLRVAVSGGTGFDDVALGLRLVVLAQDGTGEAPLGALVPTASAGGGPAVKTPSTVPLGVVALRLRREVRIAKGQELQVDNVRQTLSLVRLVQRANIEALRVRTAGLAEDRYFDLRSPHHRQQRDGLNHDTPFPCYYVVNPFSIKYRNC
eukprot:Hpha_TRINITY_DN14371_c0_g2::TRINITY_DN14371_c0_g2_i1::g.87180::m.87180